MMVTRISPRDNETLSAYLDGQLNSKDRQRLEARLAQDAALRDELQDMKRLRLMLRSLPQFRAPRNFTLTPEMVGQRQRKPARLYPVMGFASALASLLFVLVVVGDFLGFISTPDPRDAGPATVMEAAPLAMVAPEESATGGGPSLKEAAPVEESAPLVDAELALTEEARSLSPTEEEAGELMLKMTGPESTAATETSVPTAEALEVADAASETGIGGGIVTDTLDLPLSLVPPTLPDQEAESSLRLESVPETTATATPTPMPTETPVPTQAWIAPPTFTPTPMATETPVVPSTEKASASPTPTATATAEILAMAEPPVESEANSNLQAKIPQDDSSFLPEAQASEPASPVRTVLILQIGLLLLAVISGTAFVILRFKER